MGSNIEVGGLDQFRARRRTVNTTPLRVDSTANLLPGRNAIRVRMLSTSGSIFVGESSSVSASAPTSTGYTIGDELRAGEALDLGLSTRAAVWLIGGTTGRKFSVVQIA